MEAKMIVQRKLEEKTYKIRLTKDIAKKMGTQFLMKVYDDKIELIPIKEENNDNS